MDSFNLKSVLDEQLKERDELYNRFSTLINKMQIAKAKKSYIPQKYLNLFLQLRSRVKVLNNRIFKKGVQYCIVKVHGRYIDNTGKLAVIRKFEVYYSDISEFDARRKIEMTLGEHNIKGMTTETIHPGKPKDLGY